MLPEFIEKFVQEVNGENSAHDITIFTLSTCMWCKKCKTFLNDKGIKYRYVDVDKIESSDKSQILRFSEGLRREGKDRDSSLSDFYKFLPRNHCLIVRDLESGIESLLAVLPLTVAEGPTPEIELSIRLHPKPEGEPIDLTAEIVDVKNTDTNTDILMIAIRLPDLKPGEYELEIEALEKEILASSFVRKFLVKKY